MMRPKKVSQTGTGTVVIPVDHYAQTLTAQVSVSGTVTFQVEYTCEPDIRRNGTSAAAWTAFIASGSAAAAGQLETPVTAIRLNVTAGDGTATLRLTNA